MSKKIYLFSLLFVLSLMGTQAILAQTDTLYYFYSDFEDSEYMGAVSLSDHWSSPDDNNGNKWKYMEGGTKNAPSVAASGVVNAHFNYNTNGVEVHSKLVTMKMDLTDASQPFLAFQYIQPDDFEDNRLALLFKAGVGSDWDTIIKYTEDANYWTKASFNIKEKGTQYLCEDFQVAFLAMNNHINGVSVDSVVIVEQDTIQKFVKSYEYSSISSDVITSGDNLITSKAIQTPILKLKISVAGNDGAIDLNNVAFKLLDGESSYFKTTGFKLFYTVEDTYSSFVADSSTQIGTAVSIAGDEISFTGLNHELDLGSNYLWLTADIADDVSNNSYFRIGVDAESFSVNDTLLPISAIDTVVDEYIKEAIFFDNFSTDDNWTIEGDFEIAVPEGKSLATTSTVDPDHAFSGTRVLGTDLTDDGCYTLGITKATGYYAYSKELDLEYYDDVQIYMRTWNDIVAGDSATMAVSNDGGATWTVVWQRYDQPYYSAAWDEVLLDNVEDLISHQPSVRFRFGINKTGTTKRFGFNIDQFTIIANHLETDVGITQIISPFDDCKGYNEQVKIVVKNNADGSTPDRIPVYFKIDYEEESTIVYDTIVGAIAQDDSLIFTFSDIADFPGADIYENFVVGIQLADDEDATNDSLTALFYIQDDVAPPSVEDFELSGGVWIPEPNDIGVWQCTKPGNIEPYPGSPNSWILYPGGNYASGDSAVTITSGCYDLTEYNQYVVQFNYELMTGDLNDGFAIQYSTNDGSSWNKIDTTIYGRDWGWATDSVPALGQIGWSDISTETTWGEAKELLPATLSTENKVKFRVIWASDGAGEARGLTFDNFELFPAPVDVGVSSIAKPGDDCQFENTDTVEVYVKNYGYNDLKANDTIIVGVDFQSSLAAVDTFLLSSTLAAGDSTLLKIPTAINIDNSGTYMLEAYTLVEDDPLFYGNSNDTATKDLSIWPNPISGMVDSLFSRSPDTLVVEAFYSAEYTYLWFDGHDQNTHEVVESDIYYSVEITESDHACKTKDSTYVQLLFNDVGIGEIINPKSSCELGNGEYIKVTVANKGTDSLTVGETIDVSYEVNSTLIATETITLTDALRTGKSIEHQFAIPYDFSALGDYVLTTYTDYGGESDSSNDSLITTVSVFGYTPLDLGEDYTLVGLTETLDAGTDFVSYVWSTNDLTQTTVIDSSGLYWVDAVDANGCTGNDSIYVFLKVRDIKANLLFNPTSSCDRVGTENVQLAILNSGSDTITTADAIQVNYSMDEGTVVDETVTLPADLLPGQQYIHAFTSDVDVSGYGSYAFDLTARTAGDLRTSNDSLHVEIVTNESPDVDLGAETQTINGTETELDAGYGLNYTYVWQDYFTTAQTYTASSDGEYWVQVTDISTGCTGSDTVNLIFDATDYGIVYGANIPSESCQKEYEVEVVLLNKGTKPRVNEELTVGVQLGDNEAIEERFVIPGTWSAATAVTVAFSSEVSLFSDLGITNLKTYIVDDADLGTVFDEVNKDIMINEAPFVDFGGDTIQVTLPYTLDATATNTSGYLWQDGSTEPTYEVTFEAEYSVLAIGNDGTCVTSKSVYVESGSFINQQAMDNLDVVCYPNPTKDFLTIEANLETGEDFTVEMLDVTNRVVFSEEHNGYDKYVETIDLGGLSSGVYFIRISNSEIYYINQIIIE